jgi:3-oxoadipate enol-lactonase
VIDMPFAEINGIQLYHESHGQGEAVVFAHGAGGNHLSWWQQVPFFRGKYRCVTFDHRGFGRSADLPDGPGMRAYPEDLRALLDHLGIERALLVAQSMGGFTCMGFTAAYPERVRALVMADTTGGIEDATLRERLQAYRESQPQPFTLQGRAYRPALRDENPDLAFLYDSIMATNPPRNQTVPGAGQPDERYLATAERRARLEVPVLFLAGAEDAIIPAEAIRYASSLFPHGRFVEVARCGHSVYFENAPEFNRVVSSFFDEVTRGGAK